MGPGVQATEPRKITTQEKIDILSKNFGAFLKEKNRRYGDSALTPIKVFSKMSAEDSLYQRLDDKISRIINSPEIRKNDISDLMGYLMLLCIQKEWLEFDEFLD